MGKFTKEKSVRVILIFFAFLLAQCALQLPPGGGEIDTIPPEIIEVFPEDGTTNYNRNYFELRFSEWVDKRSLRDAIFISPAVDGQLELSWSGRAVRIYFPEDLRKDFTYVITIGTDVVDLNNRNRMAEAYTFTFSTGVEIDRRVISGKVYDPKPDGIMMFAYKLFADTVNPALHKPDYISQTGRDGTFKLSGLAEGTYRVFAVKDEFRDLLFQAGQDLIGMPYIDIFLAREDTLFANLNFFLTPIDTIPPRLLSAVMTDRNHILLNFSEKIDSTLIRSDNFRIADSTSGENYDILFAYKGNTKLTEMVLVTTDSFKVDNKIFLLADSLRDISGNITINDYVQMTVNDKVDTFAVSLYKADPGFGTNKADFQFQSFKFYFDDAFDTRGVVSAVTLKDTLARNIPFGINFFDDASFEIIPEIKLQPSTDYIISFDMLKFIDAAGNKADTIIQYKFKTISGMDFTGLSGMITNIDFTKNPVLVLDPVSGSQQRYTKNISGSKFNFERIEPGKYYLWAYLDEDSSKTYTHGWPFPFKPSEEFNFYPDTLELRPRWSITDLRFHFR